MAKVGFQKHRDYQMQKSRQMFYFIGSISNMHDYAFCIYLYAQSTHFDNSKMVTAARKVTSEKFFVWKIL